MTLKTVFTDIDYKPELLSLLVAFQKSLKFKIWAFNSF